MEKQKNCYWICILYWICISYWESFKIAAKKYNLDMPVLFTKYDYKVENC